MALGQSADLIIVAPATANTLAKLCHGIADDLLGTTVLASRAPLLVAPAMHTEMWENPATQANIATLHERSVHMIGPVSGPLTGADVGIGRMAEPDDIAAAAFALLDATPKDLLGRSVLISAGGTREAIDPVRFLANHSSGKQGVALAQAARDRGADVTLVVGTHDVALPAGVRVIHAETATAMRDAVRSAQAEADLIVMAAAVADYRPATVSDHKLKKSELGDTATITLTANPDILAELVTNRVDQQFIVGFAAETADSEPAVIELGREKLARKGCDLLVVNRVGDAGNGRDRVFGADESTVHLLWPGETASQDVVGSKLEVAHAILDATIATDRR